MSRARQERRESAEMDVYERAAKIWNEGIAEPAFLRRTGPGDNGIPGPLFEQGTPFALAAKAIFQAADKDPDRWAHAEAVAAWALKEPPPID
jgi:hypothetical protein